MMRVDEITAAHPDAPVIAVAVACVWVDPEASELVTQALEGEPVVVVGQRPGWSEVRLPLQPCPGDEVGYPGWVRTAELGDPGSHRLNRMSEGDRDVADQVSLAEQFLGVPYLWGGVSEEGIDCSGLIHLTARLGGFVIPRDACDQAVALPRVRGGQRGDLLFFWTETRDRIRHVGFALDEHQMLHAPHTGRFVEVIDRAAQPYARDFAWATASPTG